ncbi:MULTISPECIES: hypothetical protein [Ectothiorhodospira]|uniref:hypothetical protein n=1 Tax=Ectothiorhodospira TaxID=1051 RepID=UPI00046D413E|nr:MULTISPECIES: hypothetical protein [Ectothiorhodospira]MCG5493254.1 hypothetical protein [Ectothiorhodospira variabilis]MCG5496596.1 hypothetical protein [Ectothiorhodospira variabilis]MCG5502583.1 hypothetical protein [Ectothiorhodospira variabilis]MCG5505651.1 hypothetical protein [Ectothiorhodospira variabilis]MCG5523311.1 hypothetical protein [Ectothiorhodospira haloalkaliphila]
MALVKLVKLNNLQYNANRDPEFYRRPVGKEFRLQAVLNGTGSAKARFVAEGKTLCETQVPMPGTFDCRFKYDTAGTRVGTLSIEGNGETFTQDIRIDTTEHAWVG